MTKVFPELHDRHDHTSGQRVEAEHDTCEEHVETPQDGFGVFLDSLTASEGALASDVSLKHGGRVNNRFVTTALDNLHSVGLRVHHLA
jgi:hypothetical protein